MSTRPRLPAPGYITAIAGVSLATLLLLPFREQINETTTSLLLLLVVLITATFFGSRPAMAASVLAVLSLNFFFLTPYYTLAVAEPENWIALGVFLTAAVIVGQLSANARLRAEVAEELYDKLQEAFERASEAEAVKKSERLKSALLDAVTHDLRTPLTSIKAATTMLIEENARADIHRTLDPEGGADLLKVIDEETDRLNAFVDSMVGMARAEAGDIHLNGTASSVDEIVRNAIRRAGGHTKGRQVRVNIESDLPQLRVDGKAIAEVLYNLIDNAVKYSPPESPISIAAARDGQQITFTVANDGPGIAPDEREAVFQKFYRSDASSGGLGMGLAIARGIVEAHSGTIAIAETTKGCSVVFHLPVDD